MIAPIAMCILLARSEWVVRPVHPPCPVPRKVSQAERPLPRLNCDVERVLRVKGAGK